MKLIKLLLVTLLVSGVAHAQVQAPFSPVFGSTKNLSCTDSALAAQLLDTKGPSVLIANNGATKAFVKIGGSDVEAGTGDLVILPGTYALITRAVLEDTHVSCVMASGETTTVFVSTGYGQ